MESKRKLTVLVAPLDWGLGHATRCIPIIRLLLRKGHHVLVGVEGDVERVINRNFGEDVTILPLKGYGIRYSGTRGGFTLKIISQIPRILASIRSERKWLNNMVRSHQIDLVISDNRYGLYHREIPCIIMTHQLQVLSGISSFADTVLRRLHYRLLTKFDACWVVDYPGVPNLAGKLSHPGELFENVHYVGLLSQFDVQETSEIRDTILILLSGPEPMRSLLEEKLLTQAGKLTSFRFVVVAGKPDSRYRPSLPGHIHYFPFLSATELKECIAEASLVVCRSGYTTLMDLAAMRKKALLIPTPGQTEQEYLAETLEEKGVCLAVRQEEINLLYDIPRAREFSGFSVFLPGDQYQLLDNELDRICLTVIR